MHRTQPHDKMTSFKIFWKDMWVLRESFSSIAVPWTTCQKILYLLFVRKSSARAVFSPYQPASSVLPLRGTSGAIAPATRIHNRGTSRRAFVKRLMVRKKRVRNKWTTKQKCENTLLWICLEFSLHLKQRQRPTDPTLNGPPKSFV